MLDSQATRTTTRPARAGAQTGRKRAAETGARRTGMRPFILLAVMALCMASLTARLAYWQVLEHGHLTALAVAESGGLGVQTATRGQIFDAAGNALATDVTKDLVYAQPAKIHDPTRTATLMAPVLHMSERAVYALITRNQPLVTLSTPAISVQDGRKVAELALPGIFLDPVPRRTYPMVTTASQVLGFTNMDLKGQYGVEGYYDKLLAGTAGLRTVLRDTSGQEVRLSSQPSLPARNGGDLYLTIDSGAQGLVEQELNAAIKKHGAESGTAIVMDPKTGFILAMASAPSFDPNHYSHYPQAAFSNPATQWLYEPGSTMKVLTMAAGLDSGVITPDSALDDTGVFRVADVTIRNWSRTGFGWENMTQVLQHSANVGAAWVAGRLGSARFYDYMHRFKLDQLTGIDLDGEESGILPQPGTKAFNIVDLYTNAYGQGLSLTPLRLLESIGAVANGGVMMRPQVVRREVYDGRIIERRPVPEGRVISSNTARTLTDMLVHSAVNGEASQALVPGYDIAAKTGTANIADGHGGYLKNLTVASVIGYAPAKTPRFIVLVVLNRPKDTIWGSEAAAPVLHNIMQDLFWYYHIPPSPHAIYR